MLPLTSGMIVTTMIQDQPKRYYRLYAARHVGQLNGVDLTLYKTGMKMNLTPEEVVLKLLGGIRLVEADHADICKKQYTDWLDKDTRNSFRSSQLVLL